MNTPDRPEATTHGGKRRFRMKSGHSSIVISSVALAFCLTLLAFSVISILAPTQSAYANSNRRGITPSPIITLTIVTTPTSTPTTVVTPSPTPTAVITPTVTLTVGVTPTDTPTAVVTPTDTPIPTATATTAAGVTPTATATNTPVPAGSGAPPPGVTPVPNNGSGTPTPPSNGGVPPGSNPAAPTPTSGSNDQSNGNPHTSVNVNGNPGISGSTTDSTGMIVGASAGVVLLLIVAGVGGWMLYNRRMDQQARSSVYPAGAANIQPEQANWNAFQANTALAGAASGAPILMQQPASFGRQDNIPVTPPPNYTTIQQSSMEPNYYNQSLPTTPPDGFNIASEANYVAYHNEYATIQSHTPVDEQALLAQNYGDDGAYRHYGQPPETPTPTGSTETYLDDMMHQAQVGLFVLPDKETE